MLVELEEVYPIITVDLQHVLDLMDQSGTVNGREFLEVFFDLMEGNSAFVPLVVIGRGSQVGQMQHSHA